MTEKQKSEPEQIPARSIIGHRACWRSATKLVELVQKLVNARWGSTLGCARRNHSATMALKRGTPVAWFFHRASRD